MAAWMRRIPRRRITQRARRLMATPRGRGAVLVLIVLGLLFYGGKLLWERLHRPPPIPPAAAAGGGTIRIATWNLRQFAVRPSIDLRVIADIIQSSQFDLIALQEIREDGRQVDRLLNVLGPPWRSTSISPRTGNYERFTFIYRGDRVRQIGKAHFIETPESTIFDRTPYQGRFRAGDCEFILITAHLYYSDLSRRRNEADALARFARDMAIHAGGGATTVIVLGDFNDEHPRDLRAFKADGWKKLITQSTNLGSTEILDNILIDPRLTNAWTGRSGAVRFDEVRYHNQDKQAMESVSDHRPAWADFRTLCTQQDTEHPLRQ